MRPGEGKRELESRLRGWLRRADKSLLLAKGHHRCHLSLLTVMGKGSVSRGKRGPGGVEFPLDLAKSKSKKDRKSWFSLLAYNLNTRD